MDTKAEANETIKLFHSVDSPEDMCDIDRRYIIKKINFMNVIAIVNVKLNGVKYAPHRS